MGIKLFICMISVLPVIFAEDTYDHLISKMKSPEHQANPTYFIYLGFENVALKDDPNFNASDLQEFTFCLGEAASTDQKTNDCRYYFGSVLLNISNIRIFHGNMSVFPHNIEDLYFTIALNIKTIDEEGNVIWKNYAYTEHAPYVLDDLWMFEGESDTLYVKGGIDIYDQTNVLLYKMSSFFPRSLQDEPVTTIQPEKTVAHHSTRLLITIIFLIIFIVGSVSFCCACCFQRKRSRHEEADIPLQNV